MNEQQRKIHDSRKQEARGAAQHGGRVRPASGALPGAKGDMRTSDTLVEYKRTNGKSISITAAMLKKIRTEALSEGRRPLLGIEIAGRDWVLVPADDYESDQEVIRDATQAAEQRPSPRLDDGKVRERP